MNCSSVHSEDSNRKTFVLEAIERSIAYEQNLKILFDQSSFPVLRAVLATAGGKMKMDDLVEWVPKAPGMTERQHRIRLASALTTIRSVLSKHNPFHDSLYWFKDQISWQQPKASTMFGDAVINGPILKLRGTGVTLHLAENWISFGNGQIWLAPQQAKLLAELMKSPIQMARTDHLALTAWGKSAGHTKVGRAEQVEKAVMQIRKLIQHRYPDFQDLVFLGPYVRLFHRELQPRILPEDGSNGVRLSEADNKVYWKDLPSFQPSKTGMALLRLMLSFPGEPLLKEELYTAVLGDRFSAAVMSRHLHELISDFKSVDPNFDQIVVTHGEVVWEAVPTSL